MNQLLPLVGVVVGVAVMSVPLFFVWRELRVTQDRLYGAWQTQAIIPPRPETVKAPEPAIPIPPVLQPWVDDWEKPEDQERQATAIREMLSAGKSNPEIIRLLESRQS